MTNKKIYNTRIKDALQDSIKLGLHPIRREILKILKKHKELTANDIIHLLGYNEKEKFSLYYHLEILQGWQKGVRLKCLPLIKGRKKDGNSKTVYYSLNFMKNPLMLAFSYDEVEMTENKDEINALLDTISNIENYKIENRDKIETIEINITYDYSKGDKHDDK